MSQNPSKRHKPNMRNISRYTYETTSFQGWRVCVTREQLTFCKYVPDRVYGGADSSLAEAQRILAELQQAIQENPERAREIIEEFRAKYPSRPSRRKGGRK